MRAGACARFYEHRPRAYLSLQVFLPLLLDCLLPKILIIASTLACWWLPFARSGLVISSLTCRLRASILSLTKTVDSVLDHRYSAPSPILAPE